MDERTGGESTSSDERAPSREGPSGERKGSQSPDQTPDALASRRREAKGEAKRGDREGRKRKSERRKKSDGLERSWARGGSAEELRRQARRSDSAPREGQACTQQSRRRGKRAESHVHLLPIGTTARKKGTREERKGNKVSGEEEKERRGPKHKGGGRETRKGGRRSRRRGQGGGGYPKGEILRP